MCLREGMVLWTSSEALEDRIRAFSRSIPTSPRGPIPPGRQGQPRWTKIRPQRPPPSEVGQPSDSRAEAGTRVRDKVSTSPRINRGASKPRVRESATLPPSRKAQEARLLILGLVSTQKVSLRCTFRVFNRSADQKTGFLSLPAGKQCRALPDTGLRSASVDPWIG